MVGPALRGQQRDISPQVGQTVVSTPLTANQNADINLNQLKKRAAKDRLDNVNAKR